MKVSRFDTVCPSKPTIHPLALFTLPRNISTDTNNGEGDGACFVTAGQQ